MDIKKNKTTFTLTTLKVVRVKVPLFFDIPMFKSFFQHFMNSSIFKNWRVFWSPFNILIFMLLPACRVSWVSSDILIGIRWRLHWELSNSVDEFQHLPALHILDSQPVFRPAGKKMSESQTKAGNQEKFKKIWKFEIFKNLKFLKI